jgi:hypothetical protein
MGGCDTDFRQPFGDGARDLGARPLVEVHVHARVRGEEGREDFGQEFRRGRGVGEQPHVSFEPAGVLAKLASHPLHLTCHQPRVM